jgi:hypothetical protein
VTRLRSEFLVERSRGNDHTEQKQKPERFIARRPRWIPVLWSSEFSPGNTPAVSCDDNNTDRSRV